MPNALVSTPKFLLLVDLDSGQTEIIESERPEYYGISWFAGRNELVLSHSCTDNATLLDLKSYATSEIGYLSNGSAISWRFLSQPHQLLCGPDGKIIVTNTGRNRVQVIDFAIPNQIREAGFSDARWDRLERNDASGDHLNSIFLKDNLLYVIAHGHHKGSTLLRFSYPQLQLVQSSAIPYAAGIHNVFVEKDGRIIGCHSEIGGLVDLETGNVVWRAGDAVFSRGLAVDDSTIYIGESQITSREGRTTCSTGLWLVDRNTLHSKNYLSLGPFGAVHDLRLIDVPDYAHHGIPLVGGAQSIKTRLAQKTRSERLTRSDDAQKFLESWSDFSLVHGTPVRQGDYWTTEKGELVLLVGTPELLDAEIEYSFSKSSQAGHLSLTAMYGGIGDSKMDAFLMTRAGPASASLRVWRHDGTTWHSEAVALANNLPLDGRLSCKKLDCAVQLSINGSAVGEVRLSRAENPNLGIRVLNVHFKRGLPPSG